MRRSLIFAVGFLNTNAIIVGAAVAVTQGITEQWWVAALIAAYIATGVLSAIRVATDDLAQDGLTWKARLALSAPLAVVWPTVAVARYLPR